jgi:hypothetical protein
MSYVVSIRRPEGRAISVDELRSLVTQDESLHEASPPDTGPDGVGYWALEWKATAGAKSVPFDLQGGELCVTTPSNAALRKMQELARLLDAQVIGEEGEDLTEVEVPDREFSPAMGLSGCAVGVVLVVAALWWLVSR